MKPFGNERSRRYANALSRFPSARVLELIPTLLLVYRDDLKECTLVDLGSGTGYLADLMGPLVKEVIRVDKSTHMMRRSSGAGRIVELDLKVIHEHSSLRECADIVISVATLHHIYVERTEDEVDDVGTIALQHEMLRNWTQLLKPGGKLLVVDVCVPQIPPYHDRYALSKLDSNTYFLSKNEELSSRRLPFCERFFDLFSQFNPRLHIKWHIRGLKALGFPYVSIADLVKAHNFPGPQIPHRLVPIDFFNFVVDRHSTNRHIAYFPRESQLHDVLRDSGLHNILVTALPTPWVFRNEVEAVWFVKELFSLGADSISEPEDIARHPDFQLIKSWIEKYLGMYAGDDGVYVNWQLMFIYGEKL